MDAELLQSFRSAWALPFTGSICDEPFSFPECFPIHGSFEPSPWMRAVFDKLQDREIRQVNVLKASQTGGTCIIDRYIPWVITHDKGDILHLLQDEDMVKSYSNTRITPLLKSIGEVTRSLDPEKKHAFKQQEINFIHMNYFLDHQREKGLQSRPIKTLIGDEMYLYEPEFIQQAKIRTTNFEDTCKILFVSSAGVEGCAWDREWQSAREQYTWGFHCLACGVLQPYEWNKKLNDGSWAGVRWGHGSGSYKTADGKHDLQRNAASAHFACQHCKAAIADTPNNREEMGQKGEYILHINPNGDPLVVSFEWNAMASKRISLKKLVTEYLTAKDEFDFYPFERHKLETFYKQRLAEHWNETNTYNKVRAAIADFNPVLADGFKFLTIDCQQSPKRYYYVIASWNHSNGKVKVLDYNEVESLELCRAKQLEFGILDQFCGIDVGDQQNAICEQIVEYGHPSPTTGQWICWQALKGSQQRDGFTWRELNEKYSSTKAYSSPTKIDYTKGTVKDGKVKEIWLWHFAVWITKNIIAKLRDEGGLLLPKKDDTWDSHMNSEVIKSEVDKKTGRHKPAIWKKIVERNDYWDCMSMQAAMSIIFRQEVSKATVKKPATAETPTTGSDAKTSGIQFSQMSR